MIIRSIATLIIFSYVFIGAYKPFFGLSLGSFLSILIFPLSFVIFYKKIDKKNIHVFLYLVVIGSFFFIYRSLLNFKVSLDYIELYLIPVIYVINFYFFQLYFRNLFLIKLFIYLVLLSGLIGFLQLFNIDFAWHLRELIPNGLDDPFIVMQISDRLKPAGLSLYSVQLSYQLLFAASLSSFIYKFKKIKLFKTLIYVLLVMAFASQAISSFLGIIIVIIYTEDRLKISYPKLFITCFGIIIILIYINSLEIRNFVILDRLSNPDSSTLSRLSFLLVGILIMINYPFGVIDIELSNVKFQTIQQINDALPLLMDIKTTSFHNSFINLGVSIGFICMFLYVFIYFKLYLYFSKKFDFNFKFFFFAYLIQTLTHNSGPYTSDFYFWIIIGIFAGFSSLKDQKNEIHS